jgi:hypothetical protein
MLLVGSLAAPAAASKPSDSPDLEGGHRVTICHATSSSNPDNYWQVITVDIASSGGRNKLMGHLEHAREPNKKDGRGDAIPPYSYPGYPPFAGIGLGQPGLPSACGGANATLTVIKEFTGTEGGDDPTQFQFTVNGGDAITFDATGTNVISVPTAGTYTIVEVDPGSDWQDPDYQHCAGIELPQLEPCIITNQPAGIG